jgi:hypothetical protein
MINRTGCPTTNKRVHDDDDARTVIGKKRKGLLYDESGDGSSGESSRSAESAPRTRSPSPGSPSPDPDPPAPVDPPGPIPILPVPGRLAHEWAWGTCGFSLAPVYRAGVQVGYGAKCGRHRNIGEIHGDVECKKSVTFGAAELTEATCILRLKRWLVSAYTCESGWDPTCLRREHVKTGGPALINLAEGLTEVELDEIVNMG